MLVTITCRDKPGHLELRLKTRPAHLEWVKADTPKDTLFAGGLFAEDGTTFIGTMIIAEFDSLAAARTWHNNDPYVKAGIFGQVTFTPCRNLAPDLIAGRL